MLTGVRDQSNELDRHITRIKKQNLELLYKSERLIKLLNEFTGDVKPTQIKLCTLCFVKERSIAFQCGHFLACSDCTAKILERNPPKCPVCRAEIVETLKVFL